MNSHLSQMEIAGFLIGDCSPAHEEHLAVCSLCRSEIASFKRTLRCFRASVHASAIEECSSDEKVIDAIRRAPYRQLMNQFSAVALAAVLCVLVAVFASRRSEPAASHTDLEDAALLQSIQTDLSQTLPTSLYPLRSAVSWENE